MPKRIRVLVIDDAGFMVKALTQMLAEDEAIEVVGSARNGEEGLEKILELKPDGIVDYTGDYEEYLRSQGVE